MKNSKNLTQKMLFACVAVLSLISFAFCLCFYFKLSQNPTSAFQKASAAVLEVKATSEGVGTSYGSGVVLTADGKIITNAHVITYKTLGETFVFDTIFVRFIDKEDYLEVLLEKYDLEKDLAVLKFNSQSQLSPITLGDDSSLEFGERVFAVGNMSNHGISFTAGFVAIPHINVAYKDVSRSVIQCDLTISDGNSGGALINSRGQLIGITTFRLKDQANNIIYGISYCIPVSVVVEYIK